MGAANVNIKKLHELIETQQAVLVEYWAPWCTYCRRIGPAFDQIAEEYTDRLTVVKVNMDDDEHLWETEQVELIPTLRLYRNGENLGSIVAPESKAVIETFINGNVPEPKTQENI